ncbi:hypothetical protein HOD61_00255 [archaeon]|jgi:hypothetical protein|nr:hypothetical protein [archaeon]
MFFKKKKNDDYKFSKTIGLDKEGHNSLPKLPKLPSLPESKMGFPKPSSEMDEIKSEIVKPAMLPRKRELIATGIPSARRLPSVSPSIELPVRKKITPGAPIEDKPIFVKIDAYKAAIKSIENIKDLCKESDIVLAELTKIRSEEDRELTKWHRDIDSIKNKLLIIDKKLFDM